VITEVDLGLTSVGRFDSADSVISINDGNKKPGASRGPMGSPPPGLHFTILKKTP
jgi:hypothetical protein